jgi:hypothetical protein
MKSLTMYDERTTQCKSRNSLILNNSRNKINSYGRGLGFWNLHRSHSSNHLHAKTKWNQYKQTSIHHETTMI